MTDDRSNLSFAKVKRAIRAVCLLVLTGPLLNCVSRLDAAVARAQARLMAACGLEAAPSSVRRVHGYIPCAAVPNAIGCSHTSERTVQISDLASGDELEWIMVHEFLHLLGADHVPAGHGVMGADTSSATRKISAEDLARVPCPRVRAE